MFDIGVQDISLTGFNVRVGCPSGTIANKFRIDWITLSSHTKILTYEFSSSEINALNGDGTGTRGVTITRDVPNNLLYTDGVSLSWLTYKSQVKYMSGSNERIILSSSFCKF